MRASGPPAGIDAHAIPARAASARAADAAGHADLLGGAAAAVGGDGEPVHRLGRVGIVGEEALDRMQIALARRAGELQEGGVRPERRAVGGRHQHAFGHVLQEAPAPRRPIRAGSARADCASPGCPPRRRKAPRRRRSKARRRRRARPASPAAPGRNSVAARGGEQHDHQRRHQRKAPAAGSRPLASPVSSCRISTDPRGNLSDSLGRTRRTLYACDSVFNAGWTA